MRKKLYLNLAACYLNTGSHSDVIKACDFALEIDKYLVKAYYRRGKVYIYIYWFKSKRQEDYVKS